MTGDVLIYCFCFPIAGVQCRLNEPAKIWTEQQNGRWRFWEKPRKSSALLFSTVARWGRPGSTSTSRSPTWRCSRILKSALSRTTSPTSWPRSALSASVSLLVVGVHFLGPSNLFSSPSQRSHLCSQHNARTNCKGFPSQVASWGPSCLGLVLGSANYNSYCLVWGNRFDLIHRIIWRPAWLLFCTLQKTWTEGPRSSCCFTSRTEARQSTNPWGEAQTSLLFSPHRFSRLVLKQVSMLLEKTNNPANNLTNYRSAK